MGEIQFSRFQTTPSCYTNSYLARGSRPWHTSKAAVPKYDFGDVFLNIAAQEGRGKKSPVSAPVLLLEGDSTQRCGNISGAANKPDGVCSGAQVAF